MHYLRYLLVLVLSLNIFEAFPQIQGVVLDAITEDSIPFANIRYDGEPTAVVAKTNGSFELNRIDAKKIKISAVGYKTHYLILNSESPNFLRILLAPESLGLSEVVVTGKKQRYSRKNNPAVELMKRVVENRKKYYIHSLPDYQYDDYKKVVIVADDIDTDAYLKEKSKKKGSWFINQVEYCEMNDKWILPLQIEESVTQVKRIKQTLYKDILGHQSNGMANFSENSEEFMSKVMDDLAEEIDICDDDIRFLQQNFVSPVSTNGIFFYHYHISDTLQVGNDECYKVDFSPGNKQDFGFNGCLYICKNSVLNIKKAELSMPSTTAVNFIKSINIEQEYQMISDSVWSLSSNKMLLELNVLNIADNAALSLASRRTLFSLEPEAYTLEPDKRAINQQNNNPEFWLQHRSIPLSTSEQSIAAFSNRIRQKRGLKIAFNAMKILVDDYIGINSFNAKPNKFEFGPVKSVISQNIIDGCRVLIGGRTTPALSGRLFVEGYGAHGFKSNKWYYAGKLTYSFNRVYKEPWEYPMHQLSFSAENDILSPAQKFLDSNKDNVFTSFTVKPLKNYYWYKRQQVEYKKEFNQHLIFKTAFKAEAVAPATLDNGEGLSFLRLDGTSLNEIRTSEISAGLRFAWGEKYIIAKSGRYAINEDVTVLHFQHTLGIPHLLGGNYLSNMSEMSFLHRLQLKSFGYSDIYLKASSQWNHVPYPLLIMPKTNLSWFSQRESHTFLLMNDLEFITDRELVWDLSWSPNGKILNRVPLIKKLKLREFFSFKGMWGTLTDKNNPSSYSTANGDLLLFPASTHQLGRKPYMEMVVGLANIFKFLEIDYVRRINYHGEGISNNGVRFAINVSF